ncbi:phosphonate C-P lyase system protein PhnH [Rubrimonas cliftonensis]|uniref:Alpha-D-ribose 1-methylphosphonate 5-triphosphate synthase subunit PhnH n=1 Tax=Rubrimonas cliftonensis TaxID=89524 RepID=A0A1H3YRF3_9RHOB|nr:phosphonate C-P lyase system protein PhnH [Rubrimonas cliftonensis]SEA14116.1 alpha-D-ribose 1-methylphosphonate 5-triphosphate synthase subunit PhnH [Rubrimonas cliftonensis]
MTDAMLTGGFADPPIEAARAFRAAMEAMARPGSVHRVAGARPPAPLSPAAGALILTLCDADAPLCLVGAADTGEVRGWVAFHTGAPIVGRGACAFAVGSWEDLAPLDGYPVGTPEYPDRSATLIVDGADLSQGAGAGAARLSGPGLKDAAFLRLPDVAAFGANAERFPLGLDAFFASGDLVAALPRSTCVEAA